MPKPYIIKKHFSHRSWSTILQVFLVLLIFFLIILSCIIWINNFQTFQHLQNTSTHIIREKNPAFPTIIPLTAYPSPKAQVITPTLLAYNSKATKNAIQGIIDAHPEINLGVSFIDIKNGTQADINGNEIFTAASTTKVLIACLLLSQVEAGKHTLNESIDGATVGQHLQRMIKLSNNDSWTSLMNFIGFQYQTPFAKSLGITTYNPSDNKISPNDMALLLEELYTGKILNSPDTTLLLSYMQHTNMEALIPPAVPSGVSVYHKYGSYDNNLHDAAIIDNGKNPFVLTIYSSLGNNTINYNQRLTIFHDIVIAVENVNGISTESVLSPLTPTLSTVQPSSDNKNQ